MHQLTFFTTIILFTVANLLTSYLYLYPIFHGCGFPNPPIPLPVDGEQRSAKPLQGAPFRLLLLGDPQLEGSTSLVSSDYSYFPALRTVYSDVRAARSLQERLHVTQNHLQELWKADIPIALQSWRKQLDLFGNDFYLAHIYRTLRWSTHPSHTAVLGDLLGSQWIDDEEFESRGRRYWGRVFSSGQKVEADITRENVVTTQLGVKETDEEWTDRVINVVGNHDIGYAGDITFERIQRFERVFGKVNWETRFVLPVQGLEWKGRPQPELRLVVLNSLNIDSPAGDMGIQTETFKFMNDVEEASRPAEDGTSATILLTHLPLHKEEGICVDGPMIRYADEHEGGVIKEQNHLSHDSSTGLLDTFFGLSVDRRDLGGREGSNGIIFTGHDHEGCDVYHFLPANEDPAAQSWAAEKWNASSATRHSSEPSIREVTVRSMMGEFGGNAGLLSAWFNTENERWEFEYASCALGKQHFWWAVHVLDIVTLVMCIYTVVRLRAEAANSGDVTKEKKRQ